MSNDPNRQESLLNSSVERLRHELDRWLDVAWSQGERAIDTLGLPGVILMERAALGAVEVALSRFALCPGERVGILCGGGNNGGDGLAMARLLSQRGFEVALGLLVDPASLQGDAALNMRAAQALALPMHLLHDAGEELTDKLQVMGHCALWIDALLGTGLNRAPSAPFAAAIAHLNAQPYVLALDLPSGVEGDSGRARGQAARASVTATFALPKLGLALEPGRGLAGEVVVPAASRLTWNSGVTQVVLTPTASRQGP